MSAILSSVSLSGSTPDLRAAGSPAPAASPPAQPTATISAVAPRPVDPVVSARDVRKNTADDRPVGPPPAFEINVLQDMRATQRRPAATDQGADTLQGSPAHDIDHRASPGLGYDAAKQPPDPTLNRKI